MSDDVTTVGADPTSNGADHRPRTLEIVVVAAIVIVGVVLRSATRSHLWLDEALSVNIARLPMGSIAAWLRHDGAPPLYYWMLHGWTSIVGDGDTAVRALSSVVSIAALPVAWACGRRVGTVRTAWLTLVVLAANPFAIRYATEARMYSLEVLLVFAGILVVRRSIERPSVGRLLPVAGIGAALVWTHYWCISLVGATAVVLLAVAWRSRDAARTAAIRTLVALGLGSATFVAWLPAFLYQSQHTGTPWAVPQFPSIPIGSTFLDFAGGWHAEGWILFYVVVVLMVVGVFTTTTNETGFVLSLDARNAVWPEAAVGALALVFGSTLAYVGGSGFQTRYSVIALPCFVIVVARGIDVIASTRWRAVVVGIVVLTGFAGGVRSFATERTQTAVVASTIAARAHAGDVVVYCPDQLGPATHRVLQRTPVGASLHEVSFPVVLPASSNVELVDWVDYVARLDSVSTKRAAVATLSLAGPHAAIWIVTSPGYITHDARCTPYIDAIAQLGRRQATSVVTPDADIYEHAGLYLLRP